MAFLEARELRLAIEPGVTEQQPWCRLVGSFPSTFTALRFWRLGINPVDRFLPGQAELSVYHMLLASYEYFDKSS